jgi:hypothetical protein
MPDLNSKVKKSKPVPMPDVSDKNYKSNMPKIDGKKKEEELRERLRKPRKPKTGRVSEKERELMEKLKPSKPSSSLDDKMKKQLIEGIDFITGKSASRRIASGGEVKKMEEGGEVRASRKSARKSIDGCAVRGKTRAVRKV